MTLLHDPGSMFSERYGACRDVVLASLGDETKAFERLRSGLIVRAFPIEI